MERVTKILNFYKIMRKVTIISSCGNSRRVNFNINVSDVLFRIFSFQNLFFNYVSLKIRCVLKWMFQFDLNEIKACSTKERIWKAFSNKTYKCLHIRWAEKVYRFEFKECCKGEKLRPSLVPCRTLFRNSFGFLIVKLIYTRKYVKV